MIPPPLDQVDGQGGRLGSGSDVISLKENELQYFSYTCSGKV